VSHKQLFERLQDREGILQLVGTTEDLHLDCKVRPYNENEAQKVLAKALCGFTNAEGGVVVIGMAANRSRARTIPI